MRSTIDDGGLLNARETAERLGIKPDTLYGYVSRGQLRSVGVPGSRQRHYRVEDIERFRLSRGVERGRGKRAEALTPIIDSSICVIHNGRIFGRCSDALYLSEAA